MTYKQALKASEGNVAHCTGEAYLASAVSIVCRVHALSPEYLYNGARAAGHTGSSIEEADLAELIRLHGDGMEA